MHDNIITLTNSGIQAHREAMTLLMEARAWADRVRPDATHTHVLARKLIEEMELSYYRNLCLLFTGAQEHDGPLTIHRDMEACFFWKHEKSGYHGGLIFHLNHQVKNASVGTWSIHT